MGGKSPDFGDVAVAQGEANAGVVRDQTYANRPSQYTPWGYTAWNNEQVIDPGTGEPTTKWSQTTGLTPELQEILNKQIAIQGGRTDIAGGLTQRMANEFGSPMDWNNLQPMGTNPINQFTVPEEVQRQLNYGDAPEIGDPIRLRERAEDAIYNKAVSRLQPTFDQRRKELEIKMRNQGLGPEDEAWQTQMGGLGRQETDAYNQAIWSSVDTGRAEAGQLFGQDVTRRGVATGEADRMGNFANQAAAQQFGQNLQANTANYGQAMEGSRYANALRQQQMAEQMQQRGFSLNEINALLSGQQVAMPNMPNFNSAGAAEAAPIYKAGVDQSNFNQGQTQMGLEALGMLGSAFMPMPGG